MNKISINKTNDIEAIRNSRQGEIKNGEKQELQKTETTVKTSEDNLQFSNRATEVTKLVEQLKNLPDIGEEKVSVLRQQIQTGQYKPAAKDIADAIFSEES